MKEEWRSVAGYEGKYIISNYGNLKRIHKYTPASNKKPSVDQDGYLRTKLHNGRLTKYSGIHKLVAEAFIPNPDDKPQVNHKDGNKRNNNVNNLEWVTSSENNAHKFMVLDPVSYHRKRKAVKCKELNKIFESLSAASKTLGIHRGDIRDVANGKPRHITAGGYHWEWCLTGEYNLSEHNICELLKLNKEGDK